MEGGVFRSSSPGFGSPDSPWKPQLSSVTARHLLDLEIRKKKTARSLKMNRNPARLQLSPCWGAKRFHGPAAGWRGSPPTLFFEPVVPKPAFL